MAGARRGQVVSAGLLGVLLVSAQETAVAAVRVCEAAVSSGLVSHSSEQEARKEALAQWKAKAQTFGEPYASWRLAAEKQLTCLPLKSGGFQCLASGMPCTIDQAPGRRELREKRFEM